MADPPFLWAIILGAQWVAGLVDLAAGALAVVVGVDLAAAVDVSAVVVPREDGRDA